MKQHLSLPFPPSPILEDAVGYKKDNPELKYLGMWWEPCGDEAIISDGKITFTGNWAGYLAYVNNPRVKPLLENVNLGWSDEAAEYALLFDFRIKTMQELFFFARQIRDTLKGRKVSSDIPDRQVFLTIVAVEMQLQGVRM